MVNKLKPVDMLTRAKGLVKRSYSPYSGFRVAAVIIDDRGRSFGGVNVENSSYRMTMCAEQTAIGNMVTSGPGKIEKILVYSPDSDHVAPCGACLQAISEHAKKDPQVLLAGRTEKITSRKLSALLPEPFTLGAK